MKQVRIHGGHICLMHVQTMRDGVLIILFYQKGCVLYLKDSIIYADVMGSDHCPVGLLLDSKEKDLVK